MANHGTLNLNDIFDIAGALAAHILDPCELCGKPALPMTCLGCGKSVCVSHAFLKRDLQLICDECVRTGLAALSDPQTWPWDILGLSPPCTKTDVDKAFRRLSLLLHPDRVTSSDAETAKVLWDVVQRARTDALDVLQRMEEE